MILFLIKKRDTYRPIVQKISSFMGLNVQKVVIEGDNFINSETIIADLNLTNKFIFGVGLDKIRDIFVENPWSEDVWVMRSIPGKISIKIKEKKPVAVFVDNNEKWVVDSNGFFIVKDEIGIFTALIKIKGEGALKRIDDLFSIVNSEPLISKLVTGATLIGNRRWNISLSNNTEIKLPEEDPLDAWKYVVSLQQKKAILTNTAKIIDLRVKGKIFINSQNKTGDV